MKTTPRSQLLLVELICDLVIFILCAMVCVALLVQARVMTRDSTDLNHAVYLAQTAAESGADQGYSQDGYDVLITGDGFGRTILVQRDGREIFSLETEVG